MALWVFDGGPHEGEPLYPFCFDYTQWLYDACLAPARELLWDQWREEMDQSQASGLVDDEPPFGINPQRIASR